MVILHLEQTELWPEWVEAYQHSDLELQGEVHLSVSDEQAKEIRDALANYTKAQRTLSRLVEEAGHSVAR